MTGCFGALGAPTGNMTNQYQHLLEKSKMCAVRVMTSNLMRIEAYLVYKMTWLPAITYSLSHSTLTKKQLEHEQMQAMGNFMTKMDLNRHFPCAVTMGPLAMGGDGGDGGGSGSGIFPLNKVSSRIIV